MIQFKDVTKLFDDEVILNHVNFRLHPHEFLMIIGSNQSGKSTLLNILLGFKEKTSGEILLLDKMIESYGKKDVDFLKSQLAYMPQSFFLEEALTVEENLMTFSRNPKISFLDALEFVGAKYLYGKQVITLNGLEQRKVYLAGLLLNDPKLFVIDEPSGLLDFERANEIYEILKKINSMGKTILVATNHKQFSHYATRTLYLDKGRLV